jgi:hypothetical protein
MQIIPVQDIYNQTFNTVLGGQPCTLNVYQKSTGLFMDVLLNGAAVCTGVICQNLNLIVRAAYTGFVGDLYWQDTQGSDDPSSPGLGSRYQLVYASATDLANFDSTVDG